MLSRLLVYYLLGLALTEVVITNVRPRRHSYNLNTDMRSFEGSKERKQGEQACSSQK